MAAQSALKTERLLAYKILLLVPWYGSGAEEQRTQFNGDVRLDEVSAPFEEGAELRFQRFEAAHLFPGEA